MIPFVQVGPWFVFGLPIHVFGAMVGISILVGSWLGMRGAQRYHPGDPEPLTDMIPWGIGGGVLVGHLVHVLFYFPELLEQRGPIVLLTFWDGLTSSGGIIGSTATAAIYFRLRKIRLASYLDALALGMAPGWAVARIGCFFAHDHPGRLTDFPLAVAYPGGARHDLGLYETLVLGAIAAAIYLVARKPRKEGFLMGMLAAGYAVPRFLLDFLRAEDVAHELTDRRWAGLTFAQWLCFALLGAGLFLLLRKAPPVGPVGAKAEASASVQEAAPRA